jgi:hypothetical protein
LVVATTRPYTTSIPDDIKADIASVVHGVIVAGLHRAAGAVTLKTSGRPKRVVRDERKGAERQLI